MKYVALFLILGMGLLADTEFELDPMIYKNEYGFYYVPLNHFRPAVEKIKRGEVHEKATLEYIEKIYEKDTAIVHAGTYFGDMLPFFSSLAKGSGVWAFEPIALNFFCARQNTLLNDLKNVHLFQLALGNEDKLVLMQTKVNGQFLGGGSNVTDPPASFTSDDEFEWVHSVTLDEIVPANSGRVGLIHLDVEGQEVFALKGAENLIEKHRPVIIVELWESNEREISRFMRSIHYEIVQKTDGNGVYFPKEQITE